MKEKLIKIFLLLTTIEGIFAFIFIFWIPSMDRNSSILNYSGSRIAIGGFTLLPLGFFTWLVIKTWSDHIWLEKFAEWMNKLLSDNDRLLYLTILSICSAVFSFIVMVVFLSPIRELIANRSWVEENMISTLSPIVVRLQSLIIWWLLISIQLLVVVGIIYYQQFKKINFWKGQVILRALIIGLMLPSTIFHWSILYFRLYIFASIPHWFWKFYDKPTTHDFYFLLILLISLGSVFIILKFPRFHVRNILLLIVLGYILQVGFALIQGNGFETLRILFDEKGHYAYARYVCHGTDIYSTLVDYEDVAKTDPFFKTKPPGVFLFYGIIQKLSNVIHPVWTWESKYLRLTTFMAYVFPLLAMMAIPLLFLFSKSMLCNEEAIIPEILYIFFPNIILTPLFLDQELYPLLLIVGMIITSRIISKQSILWGFIGGGWFYISIYFSFSLIPLLPSMFLWIIFDFIFNSKKRNIINTIKIIISIGLGILILYVLFRLFLNYDLLIRYPAAITSHRLHKEFNSGVQEIINSVYLNNLEFGSWIGFPIVILLLSRFIKSINNLITRKIQRIDILFFALVSTYLALNLFGQTHSEVARLWLFIVPMVSFFTSIEVKELFKNKNVGFFLVILLQLITMYILFKYQDLD